MQSNRESSEQITEREPMGTFVITVELNDGGTVYPAKIDESSPGWKDELREAKEFYRAYYRREGIVSSSYGLNINNMGIPNATTIRSWKNEKQRLYSADALNENEKFLHELHTEGVPMAVLALIEKDLNVAANEDLLRNAVYLKYDDHQKKKIYKALELAKRYHKGQSQKRPQDKEGLHHVPYVNHPIQVANMLLRHDPSSIAMQVALLHDVVEDTDVTPEDLIKEGVDEMAVDLLKDLTKTPDESREAYLQRVEKVEGDAKLIKCIDRLHNLLRSFSIKDKKYLERYIDETEKIFLPYLKSHDELYDIYELTTEILDAMKTWKEKIKD